MSRVETLSSLATAAGDGFGAYQGGLSTPANQASFGAATAAAVAAGLSTGRAGPFLQGLGTGIAPAAGAVAVGLNIGALQNATTPAQTLSASLGIIGGVASAIAPFMPPSPQRLALTAIAAAATAAQLAIQNNQPISQASMDTLNSASDEFSKLFLSDDLGGQPPGDVIDNIRKGFEAAQRQVSPIILDLDGNGFAQRTGWLGQGDGLLVWDINGNGHIDNGRELFGDNTLLANGIANDRLWLRAA